MSPRKGGFSTPGSREKTTNKQEACELGFEESRDLGTYGGRACTEGGGHVERSGQ